MTCPRKQNSIQNASVLTNFLSGVLNSQTEKLPGDLEDAEYLLVAGFQFSEEFLFLQLIYDLLVGGQDRIYSFTKYHHRLKPSVFSRFFHNIQWLLFFEKYQLLYRCPQKRRRVHNSLIYRRILAIYTPN
jgi:hypothetical protein